MIPGIIPVKTTWCHQSSGNPASKNFFITDTPPLSAITTDTSELNLEEQTRKPIDDSQNIVVFGIDDGMSLSAIWHVVHVSIR